MRGGYVLQRWGGLGWQQWEGVCMCVCIHVCVCVYARTAMAACTHCPHKHISVPWAFAAVQAGAITAFFTHSSQNATAQRTVCATEGCTAMASASVLRAGLENAVKPG